MSGGKHFFSTRRTIDMAFLFAIIISIVLVLYTPWEKINPPDITITLPNGTPVTMPYKLYEFDPVINFAYPRLTTILLGIAIGIPIFLTALIRLMGESSGEPQQ